MLKVLLGEHKLQEGCVMALMVSEGNEESFAGFWLSKASKVSWFTGFRKFPEIKIVFLQKIKAINKISKLMASFQWNVEFHHVWRSSFLSFFGFAKCFDKLININISLSDFVSVLFFVWLNLKLEINCITAVHQFLFDWKQTFEKA